MAETYGNQTKRIVFHDTDHRHAKLKVKLKHDSLSQADFFRALITGYIENDTGILNFLDQHRIENKKQSKDKVKKSRTLIEKGKQTNKNFEFDENEIDNIFDIIEKEYPEL
tara:strand:+ start:274 stop:606 length:333 start_codon:yes stop_codon:yes gene_type:complete